MPVAFFLGSYLPSIKFLLMQTEHIAEGSLVAPSPRAAIDCNVHPGTVMLDAPLQWEWSNYAWQ